MKQKFDNGSCHVEGQNERPNGVPKITPFLRTHHASISMLCCLLLFLAAFWGLWAWSILQVAGEVPSFVQATDIWIRIAALVAASDI